MAEEGEPLLGHLADDPDREAGAGERVPPDHPLGEAELLADAAHLVLEQRTERLDELHPHVGRKAADVVVRLDLRRDADVAAGLDHVGVEGSLHEEADVTELPRLVLEDTNELLPDDPPLLLGLGDPRQAREEADAGVDVDERHVEVRPERLDDLLGLVLAQQAVVDEHARELVADRLVDEERRDRRVDAAREPADHLLGADLRADALDLVLDHRRGRPRGRGPGDVVEERLEHSLPLGRVHDLRVELHAVEPVLRVLERRDRRGVGRRGHACSGRRGRDRVAVAHPHELLPRQVVEQGPGLVERDLRLAELRHVVRLHRAAEFESHELHPVADAERGDAELEDLRVGMGRALRVDGGGSAGEHERDRVERAQLLGREAVRHELRVDARLAHAARDQLAVLAAEVQHEHRPLLRRSLRRRERDDLSLGGNSARPSRS